MPSRQSPKSRYAQTPVRTVTLSDGKVMDILENRPLPEAADPTAAEARWVETERGERLDSVADRLWQDPTLYWYLMDATTCLQVSELESVEVDPAVPVAPAKLLLPEEG